MTFIPPPPPSTVIGGLSRGVKRSDMELQQPHQRDRPHYDSIPGEGREAVARHQSDEGLHHQKRGDEGDAKADADVAKIAEIKQLARLPKVIDRGRRHRTKKHTSEIK